MGVATAADRTPGRASIRLGVAARFAPRRDSKATLLLTRVLRLMRLEGGVKAALINETVAYQLVWPD